MNRIILFFVFPLVASEHHQQQLAMFCRDSGTGFTKYTVTLPKHPTKDQVRAVFQWYDTWKNELERQTNTDPELYTRQGTIWSLAGSSLFTGYWVTQHNLHHLIDVPLRRGPMTRSPLLAVSAAQMLAPHVASILAGVATTGLGIWGYYKLKHWFQDPLERKIEQLQDQIDGQKHILDTLQLNLAHQEQQQENRLAEYTTAQLRQFGDHVVGQVTQWEQAYDQRLRQILDQQHHMLASLNLLIEKATMAPDLLADQEFMQRLRTMQDALRTQNELIKEPSTSLSSEKLSPHRSFNRFMHDQVRDFTNVLNRVIHPNQHA